MSTLFEARNLKKSYRDSHSVIDVLTGASFELAPGESLALIGQSGSGKSTLLSLLAGLESPDAGSMRYRSEDLLAMDDQARARWRAFEMGIIFQHFHLDSGLTALENIAFGLATQNLPWRQCLAEANLWLEKLQLTALAQKYPNTLSGGEKQRVAMARALIKKPSLLLADEPTGNLDAKTGSVVTELIFEQVKAQQSALILVTHDLTLARRCQRTLQLENGTLGPV